jgi:putrescine importer
LDTAQPAPPQLRRVLTLTDLVVYGMVLIQPTAPVPLYGVAESLSNGHFLTTILIAMAAMTITAFSYGRMAAVYPAAGSAYTYVGKGLNPHLGFLVGWAMLLDYLLQPLITAVWLAAAVQARYITAAPFPLTVFLVIALITGLNLRGAKTSARATKVMLIGMCAVIGLFLYLAVRYLFGTQGWSGLLSTRPFYNPATFNSGTIWTATSFAALTYIGFDGVTTLSEEVENPRRNILLATVLVCILTGILSGIIVYLGQQVWPDWKTFPNLETAFMDICRRVGGTALFQAMGLVMLVAMLGSGLTGGAGAARLLFGMGRDGVLPRRIFAKVSESHRTPVNSILAVGILAFGGALALGYIGQAFEHAGSLLNFGAFLAFMGVNLAAFRHFTWQRGELRPAARVANAVVPLIGFLFCGAIWLNLNIVAKIAGGIWLAAGVVYLAFRTRGFRVPPPQIDFSES